MTLAQRMHINFCIFMFSYGMVNTYDDDGGCGYYRTLIGNATLEVEPSGRRRQKSETGGVLLYRPIAIGAIPSYYSHGLKLEARF